MTKQVEGWRILAGRPRQSYWQDQALRIALRAACDRIEKLEAECKSAKQRMWDNGHRVEELEAQLQLAKASMLPG